MAAQPAGGEGDIDGRECWFLRASRLEIVAYLACEHLAWPPLEVARALALSPSSAVEARARGAAVLAATGAAAIDVLRAAGVTM